MTMIARPNAWVAVEDDPQTQLTYAPRVDPAPLTVSVPGRDATLGSLIVVITNGTAADVAVTSITLTITVGTPGVEGAPLMPTTANVKTLVSDTTTWAFNGPSSPVTSGTADYVLAPAAGSTATLAAGAAVVVQIYDFQTVPAAGTSTVAVAEVIGGGGPAFTNIAVSTFPDGFFFDSLTVSVRSGGNLLPVAQVANGTGVTLTWNSSLVDTAKQTVYWSSATGGQQQATPSRLGEWSTPANAPLTSDTVFVVVVGAQGVGGEPLTASLATAVSVQNPALVASTVSTGGLTVTGNETVAGSLAANGGLSTSAATVSGALAANGGLTASAATVSGPLTANGGITANSDATVNGALIANAGLTASAAMVNGYLTAPSNSYLGYVWIARLFMNTPAQAGIANTIYATNNNGAPVGYYQNTVSNTGTSTGLYAAVVTGGDYGFGTNGRTWSGSGNAPLTHLETRDGRRVVTSPLSLEPEVHVSGRARLSGGRAEVELDPAAADIVLHGDEHTYRVLVTPCGLCNGVAVTERGSHGFVVQELMGGESDAEFDWLVIGLKREALGAVRPAALPDALPDVPEPDPPAAPPA